MSAIFDIGNLQTAIPGVAALGTAAFGLVDGSKAFRGGISNVGFPFISNALEPFRAALEQIDDQAPFATIKANWINAVPKADQKMAARNLIRLGLNPDTAPVLAEQLPGIDGAELAKAVAAITMGQELAQQQLDLLGRFDAFVDSRLDAAFERADQKFRNVARVTAGLVAIILAVLGQAASVGTVWMEGTQLSAALLVGIVAVPLAPIAKDLTSAITTAVSAFKAKS